MVHFAHSDPQIHAPPLGYQVRLASSQLPWEACGNLLATISKRDLTELMAHASVPRPIVQLLWSLQLLSQHRRQESLPRGKPLTVTSVGTASVTPVTSVMDTGAAGSDAGVAGRGG